MFDIDTFVEECRGALAESRPALAVKELVERAVSVPADIDNALGTASTSGSSWVTSCRLAPVTVTAIAARPEPSVSRWCFVPPFRRSTGLGPVRAPQKRRGRWPDSYRRGAASAVSRRRAP